MQAIKAVAESAMREVVGQNKIEPILTQDREPVQMQVRELMQKTLDSYGAGVTITRVQMQKADPPSEVIAGLSRRAGRARRPGAHAQRRRGLCQQGDPRGARPRRPDRAERRRPTSSR